MPFTIQKANVIEEKEEPIQGNFTIQKAQPIDEGVIGGYITSAGKGLLEGFQQLGRIMGPLQTGRPEEEIKKEFSESLDFLVPQNKENYVQRSLRRGAREAPTMLAFPGSQLSTLPRSIAAGFLGEGAKDLGLPEWAQTAAELTAYIGPDITKKLLETGKKAEIIKAAREFGLKDEQIAPLLQGEFKQKWLSKLSPKKGRSERVLKETKKGLDIAAETLQKGPEAAKPLNQKQTAAVLKELGEQGYKIASETRNKISQDMVEFLRKPITGDSLIELYRKVNKTLGPNAKEISLLKEPIKKAIGEASPELLKDFEKLNGLYEKYYKLAPKLKPTLTSEIVSAAESLGIVGSLLTGYYPLLTKILVEQGAKITARELLLNPRLQQLSEKMLLALNENAYRIAAKAANEIYKEINKKDKNIKIQKISEEDLKEKLKTQE